jgi:hypothetical protein
MASLEELQDILIDMEQDIQEVTEAIDHQREIIRELKSPFDRKMAIGYLTDYEHRRTETLMLHEDLSKEIAEKKFDRGN